MGYPCYYAASLPAELIEAADWAALSFDTPIPIPWTQEDMRPPANTAPCLVLCDLDTGFLAAAERIAALRVACPWAILVAVSRHKDFDVLRRLLADGIAGYLVYPQEAELLLPCLERARNLLETEESLRQMLLGGDRSARSAQLKRLLHASVQAADLTPLLDAMAAQHAADSGSVYAALCIWPKYSTSGMEFEEISFTTTLLEKLTVQFFSRRGGYAATLFYNGSVMAALELPGSQDAGGQVYRALLDFFHAAEPLEALDLVIGVSTSCSSPNDLRTRFHEATRAMMAHSMLGNNRVIFFRQLTFQNPAPAAIFTPERVGRISGAVELLDAQTLDAEIDELLHVTQGGRNAAMTPLFYLYSRFFDVFLTALRRRDVPMDRVYDIQDHYNQEAQDADTPQALTAALRTWTAGQLRLLRQQNREPGTAIELAQRYIRKNYARPLTRTDLAALVGFNPNYFSTCFHAVTGVRFSDYLQKIRIERAKQLLTTTLLPIAEVSRQVGYPDYRHFCKLFSRQTGLPPSEYRKRRRGLAEESPQG